VHNLRIKLDMALIKFMALFEKITRASVKDCFEQGERIVFIVNEGQIGKAIGKGSVNVKKIEDLVKKKIRIIEYNSDMHKFVQNVVHPFKLENIEFNDDSKVLTLTAIDSKTRGYLIGRGGSNLRNYESVLKRHAKVSELKVN